MPSHIELAEYGLKRIRKIYSSDLLDEIIIDLHFLIDSGIYGNLLEVYYNWEEPVPLYGELNTDIALKNDILVMAIDNLKNFPIKFLSDLIDYGTFYFFFPFLEWVYSMNLKRQLTYDDVERLFLSSLGERILCNLEDFDNFKPHVKLHLNFSRDFEN